MTRRRIDGRGKRAGGSAIPITRMNCPATTGSASTAVGTPSKNALLSRIDSGRGPSTSGSARSEPTAVCHATRIHLADARRKRRGRPRSPRMRQSRNTIASIAATVMPRP